MPQTAMNLPALLTPPARLARAVLWLHLVLSPLIFCTATAESFEENKAALLTLTALTFTVLGLCVLTEYGLLGGKATGTDSSKAARSKPEAPAKDTSFLRWRFRLGGIGLLGFSDPITLAILFFTTSAIVSTVFSINPHTSWRGAPDSHAGLVTILGGLVLFLTTRKLYGSLQEGRRLLSAVVIPTAVACGYALVQFAQWDPFSWDGLSIYAGHVRPFGTLGHPNFLGGYLVLTTPFFVSFAEQAWRNRRWVTLVALVLLIGVAGVVIVLTLSRAAWLAAGSAAIVLLGCRCRTVKRAAAVLGLLALAAGVCVLILGATRVGPSLMERLRHLASGAGRWQIWEAAWKLFLDRPLLGWGPDTFQQAFGRHRPLDYAFVEWDTTPTRAHNEILHVLATQGLLGAAALLVLIFSLVRGVIRALRDSTPENHPFAAALAASLMGFAVQSLFGYTVVSCGTLFLTCAAFLDRPNKYEVRSTKYEKKRSRSHLPRLCFVLRTSYFVLLVLVVWKAVVQPFEASWVCHTGDRLLADQPREALAAYQQAVRLDTGNTRLWTKLSGAAQLVAQTEEDPQRQQSDLQMALAALERAVTLEPQDPFHHANLGRLLGDPTCRSLTDADRPRREWETALALDPDHALFLLEASRTALAWRDIPRARAYAQHGRALFPDWALFLAQLGACALVEGRFAEAAPLFDAALYTDWGGDEDGLTRTHAALATTYLALRQPDRAWFYATQAVERRPSWPTAHFLLAQALHAQGHSQAARREYGQVLHLAPNHAGAQTGLRQLDTPVAPH
jgi:putative inorganic carbon (HCO3(-)) transporter